MQLEIDRRYNELQSQIDDILKELQDIRCKLEKIKPDSFERDVYDPY